MRIAYPLVAASVLLSGLSAPAADYAWNNAAGGNWNVNTNWLAPVVPTAADSATIALGGTYTVTLSDTRNLTNLTIGAANATLNQTGGLFTLSGTFAVNSGTYNLSGGTLALNGTMTTGVTGAVNWTGGTLTGTGTINGVIAAGGGTRR